MDTDIWVALHINKLDYSLALCEFVSYKYATKNFQFNN